MTKTLFLLRHCVTTDSEKGINGSQTDTPLSASGLQEAKELIPKLSQQNYDLIIVSSLRRTIQSVTPYLDALDRKPQVVVEPLTIERSLGSLTNTFVGDGKIAADMLASGKSKIEWAPPDGESSVQVYQRARKFLKKIEQKKEKNILICGHQNFLRCVELILRSEPIDDEHFYSELPPRLKPGEMREYTLR